MAEEVLFQMESEARDASRRVSTANIAQHSVPRRRNSSGSDIAAMDAGNAAADGRANGFKAGFTSGHTNGAAIGCQNGDAGASAAAVQWDGQRLYWFDEAPPVLQYNKFVRSGYRAGMSYRQCACSIFSYHNEIGNIWTHLLPLLALLAALLLGWLPAWPGAFQNFYGQLGGILVCLCGSVTYHTLMAHHQNYRTWLAVDVCGIFVLFLSGVQVVAWWGLRCWPTLRAVYVTVYYSLAFVSAVSAVRAKSVVMRALPMLVLFLVRMSLTVLRYTLPAGSPAATRHYFVMEVLSLLGGTVNAMRWPERHFQPKPGQPGRFDYWLNSHQLMHILVVIAMAHLHRGATLDFWDFNSGGACPA